MEVFIKTLENKQNELQIKENETVTANGAKAYKSTLSNTLDLFSTLDSTRQVSQSCLYNYKRDMKNGYNTQLENQPIYNSVFKEDKLLYLKLMFYIRDIRGGQGEKAIFKTMFLKLEKLNEKLAVAVIPYIPVYGSYKDVLELIGYSNNENVKSELLELVRLQLVDDIVKNNEGMPISLLAKYLPNIKTKNIIKRKALNLIVKKIFKGNQKEYRQTVSSLKKQYNLVETNLTNKTYSKIDYEQIPSQAMKIYSNTFENNDYHRFNKYIDDVKQGKKKINAGTLTPVDIIHKYRNDNNTSIDTLWSNLNKPHFTQNVLPVIDTSLSMTWSEKPIQPLTVAIALGMFLSENNSSKALKDKFITFSADPQLIDISGLDTVKDKYEKILDSDWGSNTDFHKVFSLILELALDNDLKQSDIPEYVIVFSDMQFDECVEDTTPHHALKQLYKNYGYDLPKIIYWNIESNSNFPVTHKEDGTILLSGYSTTILGYILNNIDKLSEITPKSIMLEALNSPRYSVFDELIK